jgi:NAD(P)-dependent dehydrogenase (short-subunit alcohol dehydrogenase family)
MSESRVVLLTGGGRGLGRVMAHALVAAGHRVILSSTDQASLTETANTSSAPTNVTTIVANLAESGAAEQLAEEAQQVHGQVDILVNNAGVSVNLVRTDYLQKPFMFWEANREIIENFFAINAVAPMVLAIKLAPAMVDRGWGRIVSNTTSLDTMLRFSLYGGSKAALEAETAVWSKNLEGSGVTANVLVPGGGAGSRMTDEVGLPRDQLLPPEIMAAPMVFLASDESAGFTGRRILANRWIEKAGTTPVEIANAASDPIAWTGVGAAGVHPESVMEKR